MLSYGSRPDARASAANPLRTKTSPVAKTANRHRSEERDTDQKGYQPHGCSIDVRIAFHCLQIAVNEALATVDHAQIRVIRETPVPSPRDVPDRGGLER